MKRKRHKKLKLTYIKTTLFTLFLCLLFMKGYTPFEYTGDNSFHITLNGQEVGVIAERDHAQKLLQNARRAVVADSRELIFLETDLQIEGEEVLYGYVDSEKEVQARMEEVLRGSIVESMHRSYTLKVNNFIVNLSSLQEVEELLQAAINKYGNEDKFQVSLAYDNDRAFSVLESTIVEPDELNATEDKDYSMGGVMEYLQQLRNMETTDEEMDFEDYELGIMSMDFPDKVEVVEVYLPESQLAPLGETIDQVIMEQETASIYTVESGDTLSEIAIKVNIPMDKIVEMNDSLADTNSMLRVGQELVITVPEPKLSVRRVEQNYYEEIYDADVIIIDVDEWFTNQTEILQQPSAGFRKVIADVTYLNDKQIGKEIIKEEIVMEAVPKIMKRGTKIPPTYIKPISGGRLSSGFGRRTAPKKGASTYHKGVDWATPTGTAVYASCGGTVAKAGWGSGYGYVVYINHIDGKQTRYGHLSKVLVSTGQTVKQGDKIALSGNTGVSTGPHLHFEILVNGSQVDPFKYVPH